jgi:hypothetical protein
LRKPKHSVLSSVVVATVAFPFAFVLFGVLLTIMVGLCYLLLFKRFGDLPSPFSYILHGTVTATSAYISLWVYRRFRWGKVAAPGDGDGGHAPGGTGSKHSTCEDAE